MTLRADKLPRTELLARLRVACTGCVLLVPCGAKKGVAGPARRLYIGDAARSMIEFTEDSGLDFFILSARHGILGPDDYVEPYDTTIGAADCIDPQHLATQVNALSRAPALLFNRQYGRLMRAAGYPCPILIPKIFPGLGTEFGLGAMYQAMKRSRA